MHPKLQIQGMRFGRWLVIEPAGNVKGRGEALWLCRCDCGTERNVVAGSLNSGASKSCGCLAAEAVRLSKTKHGMSGTRLHSIWKNMRRRCLIATTPRFSDYGGRGISICAEWSDFSVFHSWATKFGYADDLTLERVDVDGNYEPTNCTWVTRAEQSSNQRRTVRDVDGVPWHLKARANGISQIVFKSRISYGWSYHDAATKPVGPSNRKKLDQVASTSASSS